jgi:tetratricopeptide (TPR) repeat protein
VNDPKADEFRVGATPVRDVLRTAALALEGEVLEAAGDLEGAIARYREAVAIEDQNNYTEPPDWPQPIRHYLGAALIAAGRAEEAEAVYRRDLRWNQNNGWSLFGLQQALALQGKNQEADAAKADYRSAWRYSGIDLARSRR